jgi:V/A-type H+-transporting ATPase subunit E
MKILGSPEAVIAVVREEAEVEVERLERSAREEEARLRAAAATEPIVLEDRERRLAAARRDARERLARDEWLDARDTLAAREEWLEEVVRAAGPKLASIDDPATRRGLLGELVFEACQRLPEGACDVLVSATDAPLLDEPWIRAAAAHAGRASLTVSTADIDGGCIVRTADGRASFDNTLRARAERLAPVWRAALCAIYDADGQRAKGVSAA